MLSGLVVAVSMNPEHTLRKPNQECVRLLAGLGVEGDAHLGKTAKHRSRVRRDPTQPNLRQVHLVHSELLEELGAKGIPVLPGAMGENITTRGIDLLALPTGAILHLGQKAKVQITGLRSPCSQLDSIHETLKSATLERDEDGGLIRKAGIMSVVLEGGDVRSGDPIRVELPPKPHRSLEPV